MEETDTSPLPLTAATEASSFGLYFTLPTFGDTPNNISDLKCNQYVVHNKTFNVIDGYEGIPQNLLINFVGWIVSN